MKKILILIFLTSANYVFAGNIDSNGTYTGKIKSVAVGHWGHVGVEMEGATCNGRKEAILLKDNPFFKNIFSALLASQASKQISVLYRVTAKTHEFSPGYKYCVINSMAIGDFYQW